MRKHGDRGKRKASRGKLIICHPISLGLGVYFNLTHAHGREAGKGHFHISAPSSLPAHLSGATNETCFFFAEHCPGADDPTSFVTLHSLLTAQVAKEFKTHSPLSITTCCNYGIGDQLG